MVDANNNLGAQNMKKELLARAIFATTKTHSVTFYWAMPVATLKTMYVELIGALPESTVTSNAPVKNVEIVPTHVEIAPTIVATFVPTDPDLDPDFDAHLDADALIDLELDSTDFYYAGFETDAEEIGTLFDFHTVD